MILLHPDILPDHLKIFFILDYLDYPLTYDRNSDYDIVLNSSLKDKHKFIWKSDKPIIPYLSKTYIFDEEEVKQFLKKHKNTLIDIEIVKEKILSFL